MNNSQKNIIHRLKITNGHLKKVVEMSQNGAYCIDIIHQLQAVKAALGKIENKILDNHLNTCVFQAFKTGKKDQAIREVLSVFEKTR